MRKLKPLHPGITIEANLEAMEISAPKAASIMSISKQHLYRVIKGESPITPDLSYRIGMLFGNGARFWLNLQTQYDVYKLDEDYRNDTKKIDIAENISRYI